MRSHALNTLVSLQFMMEYGKIDDARHVEMVTLAKFIVITLLVDRLQSLSSTAPASIQSPALKREYASAKIVWQKYLYGVCV